MTTTPIEDQISADTALLGAGEDQFVLQGPADGQLTYGDSRTAIVDQLYPEHLAAQTAEEKFQVRLDALVQLATIAQTEIATTLDLPDDEDFLTALFHDRATTTLVFDEWDVQGCPLFLIATGYAPYSEIPRPAGEEIVWLDPLNETTFLSALEALGLVELLVKDPRLVPDPAE